MYTREQIKAWKDSGLLDYFANGGQLEALHADVWYPIDRIDMTLPPTYYRRKDVPVLPAFSEEEVNQQLIRDLNDYINDGKLLAWAVVALFNRDHATALVNNNFGKYCGCNTAAAVKNGLVQMTSLSAADWHARNSGQCPEVPIEFSKLHKWKPMHPSSAPPKQQVNNVLPRPSIN